MKTGINLPLTDHSSMEEYLITAKKSGFSHVSLSSPLAAEIALGGIEALNQFENLLAKHHLKVDWIHVPFLETHFYHPQDEFGLHALSTAKLFLEIARVLHANSIVCHPLNEHYSELTSDCSAMDIRVRLKRKFRCLVEEAVESSVRVAVENLRHPESHRILCQLLEDLPDLDLCFDTGHSELTRSHSLYLDAFIQRIKCLHMADNFGWQDDHLPPGDGILDFPAIVKKLRRVGYDGVWCLEISTESTGRNWAINDFVRHSKDNLLRIFSVTQGEQQKPQVLSSANSSTNGICMRRQVG
jgi:sugar phosphate isomerase/epimerase